MTTDLGAIRISPRSTVHPGDVIRVKGYGSKLFRVTAVLDRNGHTEVNLWGPVLKNGLAHQRAKQRTVRPEDIASKTRILARTI